MTSFGLNGDKPQPADYDGDGKSDLGLFRPSTGTWEFLLSGNHTQKTFNWGLSGDIPASSLSMLSQ